MDILSTAPADTFADRALSSTSALASVLDHTLLKPEATHQQVLELCAEAAEYRFACAMINPCWVPLAVDALRGTGVPVGVVIGFPLGATSTGNKLDEMESVIAAGAHDIDMVLNVGFLKSGMDKEVASEIRQLALLAHGSDRILKVILETALLSADEKHRASHLAVDAGADFIKTSTGFSTGGATVADITLMRSIAGDRCGVKASGGIRSLADASTMLRAGASRIGASASVRIVGELASQFSGGASEHTGRNEPAPPAGGLY